MNREIPPKTQGLETTADEYQFPCVNAFTESGRKLLISFLFFRFFFQFVAI